MLSTLEHLNTADRSQANLFRRVDDRFDFHWHHHPEYELTLITRSAGRRLVGNSIESYSTGDLVLLGPLLAHTWHSNDSLPSPHSAVIAQFHRDAVGTWPEIAPIRKLLDRAKGGLRFSGKPMPGLCKRFELLPDQQGLKRITGLLDILDQLATNSEIKPIVLCTEVVLISDGALNDRIADVLLRMSQHFNKTMSQAEEAKRLHMTPSGFARLFQRSVGKRFTQILHELRIAEACRLLRETNNTITTIAFVSGFNNLSNFNRVFLRLKGMSPRDYRSGSWPST